MASVRRGIGQVEADEIWRLWRAGRSVSEIARATGRAPGTIHCWLVERGGIAPRPRRRRRGVLTAAEREEISRGLARGCSLRQIAEELGRAPSTICREIARNGGRDRYRAADAEVRASVMARRPQEAKLARCPKLAAVVAEKLAEDWSPEQIAGWLKNNRAPGVDGDDGYVSHETIYRSLFIQAKGLLHRELRRHLRSGRLIRHARSATRSGQRRGQIKDALPISERPAEAADRAVPGHWEGDLITGANNTHIATLVERLSRFTVLVKVPGKDTASVVGELIRAVNRLPDNYMRSLTWDRGTELADHKRFSMATDTAVYFCDPQSPWQRGTNENTNRLLRQYFPKGTNLSRYTQEDLDEIAAKLNNRPRKTLDYQTPVAKLSEAVALTG